MEEAGRCGICVGLRTVFDARRVAFFAECWTKKKEEGFSVGGIVDVRMVMDDRFWNKVREREFVIGEVGGGRNKCGGMDWLG